MVTAPSFFWNNFTQRVLSQSNNISYAARGIYRVHDTEPNRKGDYWFRDFGMVMTCAYLTELGFRAVETLNTIPLATEALNLHKLSELRHPITGDILYPGARNYSNLPEIVRERVMGTLIRNSADMVPNLMKVKELELRQGEKLPDALKKQILQMLKSPAADGDIQLQNYLRGTGLNLADIRLISKIENITRRNDAIKVLHLKHRGVDINTIKNAVKLEDARQMGILVDHLHRNLNFSEYLKTKYLSDHKLSGNVSEVIREYADKLANMQQKGKKEFSEAIEEALTLPINKREAAFTKHFEGILASLELRKGILIATDAEYQKLRDFADQTKAALKADDHKKLKAFQKRVGIFYQNLERNHLQHLENLTPQLATDLKTKLTRELEAVVQSVQQLEPGENPRNVVAEKLDKLNLGALIRDDRGSAIDALKQKIQELLPDNSQKYISADQLKEINAHIRQFINTDLHDGEEKLLAPLFKQVPSKAEFQRLIMDGLHSKAISGAVSRIQKNGTWPKMAATVLLNLFFYGFLASNFDNKILQPFQKKLVAERGTSQDIVTAGYMGVVPGLAVLTQLIDSVSLPIFKRMGYFTRFAVVGGAALAAFACSTYAFLMQRLNNAPSNQPTPPLQHGSPFYPSVNTAFSAPPVAVRPSLAQPIGTPFQPYPSKAIGVNHFALAQAPAATYNDRH